MLDLPKELINYHPARGNFRIPQVAIVGRVSSRQVSKVKVVTRHRCAAAADSTF